MSTQEQMVPVILCGGSGTRLWPMSRAARPKQFLPLTGDLSQYQKTLLRVSDASLYAPPVVVTNQEYRFLVAEQAQEAGVPLASIILEPEPPQYGASHCRRLPGRYGRGRERHTPCRAGRP